MPFSKRQLSFEVLKRGDGGRGPANRLRLDVGKHDCKEGQRRTKRNDRTEILVKVAKCTRNSRDVQKSNHPLRHCQQRSLRLLESECLEEQALNMCDYLMIKLTKDSTSRLELQEAAL